MIWTLLGLLVGRKEPFGGEMENIELRSGIPGSVDSSVNLQEKMIHKKRNFTDICDVIIFYYKNGNIWLNIYIVTY